MESESFREFIKKQLRHLTTTELENLSFDITTELQERDILAMEADYLEDSSKYDEFKQDMDDKLIDD